MKGFFTWHIVHAAIRVVVPIALAGVIAAMADAHLLDGELAEQLGRVLRAW